MNNWREILSWQFEEEGTIPISSVNQLFEYVLLYFVGVNSLKSAKTVITDDFFEGDISKNEYIEYWLNDFIETFGVGDWVNIEDDHEEFKVTQEVIDKAKEFINKLLPEDI